MGLRCADGGTSVRSLRRLTTSGLVEEFSNWIFARRSHALSGGAAYDAHAWDSLHFRSGGRESHRPNAGCVAAHFPVCGRGGRNALSGLSVTDVDAREPCMVGCAVDVSSICRRTPG